MDFERAKECNPELFNWKDELGFEEITETDPSKQTVPLSYFSKLQSRILLLLEELQTQKSESLANFEVNQSALKILRNTLEKYKTHTEKLKKSNESKTKKLLVYKEFVSQYCKDFKVSDFETENSIETSLEGLKSYYTQEIENLKTFYESEIQCYQQKIKELLDLLKKEKEKSKKTAETAKKAIEFAKSYKNPSKLEEIPEQHQFFLQETKKFINKSPSKLDISKYLSLISSIKCEIFNLKSYISTICQKLPLLLSKQIIAFLSKSQFSSNFSKLMTQIQNLTSANKKLLNQIQNLKGNIRIFCRIRPTLKENQKICIFNTQNKVTGCSPLTNTSKIWEFDHVFGSNSSQSEVFSEISNLITSSLDGYNVCIFTYGQTGSGKTYTLEGPENDPGIITRTALNLFSQIKERIGWDFMIKVSLLEVYNENLVDLLNEKAEKLKVFNGQPSDLTVFTIKSYEELISYLKFGLSIRAVGSNCLNSSSSRSHLVMTLYIQGKTSNLSVFSKIQLIDLAGSERLGKTGTSGETLNEAKYINLSLLTLGNVISAIRQDLPYIPFRNSVLTQILKESLSGQAKMLMILQIAPEEENYEETVCSLNFASNARNTSLGAAKANFG